MTPAAIEASPHETDGVSILNVKVQGYGITFET